MNEQEHFKRFKGLHRSSMLTKVEQRSTTKPINGNGSSAAEVLQEALQLPREPSLWERIFTWERDLTVAGKVIEKGLVITPTMGLTIFLAIAGVVGTMYWRTNEQIQAQTVEAREVRDMVIEMKTRLDERTSAQKEAESERKREQRDSEEIAKVWRETITQRMNEIDKRGR